MGLSMGSLEMTDAVQALVRECTTDLILKSIAEFERRIRGESPNFDALRPLCAWLEKASGSATTVIACGLAAACSKDEWLEARSSVEAAEWLYAQLEADETAPLTHSVIERFIRVLYYWANERQIPI
jgi:hypothetical protein